jgi:hypothetical protein
MVVGFLMIPGAARADIDTPVWKNGNFWVYEGTGGAGGVGGAGHVKLRLDVVGTEAMSVGGTSYESYHTRVAVNVTSSTVPIDSPGDAWFRTSDLSLLKLVLTTLVTTPFGSFIAVTTVTMNPPQRMQWPLSAGATWTVSGVATVVLEITGQPPSTNVQTVSGTATVGAVESRTVTAGRFDANPVTLTTSGGNSSKTYWSRETGNYVEQTSHDSSNRDTGSSQLTSYSYSPPASLGGAGAILGLPWYVWIVVVGIAVAVVVVLVAVRRRPRMPAPVPPDAPMTAGPATPVAPIEPGPPNEPPPPAP